MSEKKKKKCRTCSKSGDGCYVFTMTQTLCIECYVQTKERNKNIIDAMPDIADVPLTQISTIELLAVDHEWHNPVSWYLDQ